MNRKLTKSIAGTIVGAAMLTTAAVAPVAAQSRAHRAEAARLGALYSAATPGSPAQFRIHEALDRLAATNTGPPSAAAFRLAEERSR